MESSKDRVAKSLGVVFLIILLVLLLVKAWRQGIYSSRMGLNIVVLNSDRVGLLMLRPEEEMVGWVTFPEALTIKIFNSEARYPATSLWHYGLLEKNPYEMVEKSLGLSMGVVVARVIEVGGEVSPEGVLAQLYRVGLKTDLSVRDRILIRRFLAESLSAKKVLEMDLPSKIFDKTVEPDGRESLVFGSIATLWTKNKFVLESILGENVDLTVNNLSGQSGLGTQVARQLESAGMRVVGVKSDLSEDTQGSGCIFAVWGHFPFTESLLTDQMRCQRASRVPVTHEEKGMMVWLK